jgi:acetyl esterase/lipase
MKGELHMHLEQYVAFMDPELRTAFEQMLPLFQNMPEDPVAVRKLMEQLPLPERKQSERVLVADRHVPGPSGAPEVPVRIYTPVTRTGMLSGLFWIHGGGFTAGNPEQDDALCERIVEEVGCVIVSVDYRLAPEHPFPAGPEDCYAALRWMSESAAALGIDRARIAIGGASAGGGLAAAVALMARDRKEVPLVFELLIYPCLDDRHITPSSKSIAARGMLWDRESSLRGWKAYLGSDRQGEVSPYAAPARVPDVAGLPPTYIMIGELDLMRDESIDYAMRLMQADIPTQLHVYPGAFNGFDLLASSAAISQRAISEYIQALEHVLKS